ncbi:hypothetical protein MRX96_000094 [Rhipicephalus microplus]
MSPKGAKYRTAHVYRKRRKPWNKRRRLDTETNATDLTKQEMPEHVGDRESSPVCDRDSASICAGYDLTVRWADGAPACSLVSMCRVDGSACGVDVSTCRVEGSRAVLMCPRAELMSPPAALTRPQAVETALLRAMAT